MDFGDTDSLQPQGRLTMRLMLGTAIALPLAGLFCLAYLTFLALETWRDASRSHRVVPDVPLLQRETWTGQRRIAA
jgi:threonine/homoserine/homoserine lactone efflux protein